MVEWKTLNIQLGEETNLPDSFIVFGNKSTVIEDDLFEILSLKETQFFNRIKNKKQLRTQQTCRIILKVLLSKLLDIEPKKIEIKNNKWGKPYIENYNLFFNISHTESSFIIYISKFGRTGIDIEKTDKTIDYKSISEYSFSINEKSKCTNLQQFYQIWTLKEAFLKYIGIGLINNLQNIDSLKSITKYNLFAHTFECPNNDIATIISKDALDKTNYFLTSTVQTTSFSD